MNEVVIALFTNDLVVFGIGYAFGYFTGRSWKWGLCGGIGAIILMGFIKGIMTRVGG